MAANNNNRADQLWPAAAQKQIIYIKNGTQHFVAGIAKGEVDGTREEGCFGRRGTRNA